MSTPSNTVKSLAKKHAEIQGDIQKTESLLLSLRNALGALEVSIHVFDPDYNVETIMKKRKNSSLNGFQYGEITKLTGEFVRNTNTNFKTHHVLDYMLEQKQTTYTPSECDRIKHNISNALDRLLKQGIIERCGFSGKGGAIIWRATH